MQVFMCVTMVSLTVHDPGPRNFNVVGTTAFALPMGHAIFETMLSQRWRVGAMSILLTVKQETLSQSQAALYKSIDDVLADHLNNGVMCTKEQVFGVPLEVAGKWFSRVAERSFHGNK